MHKLAGAFALMALLFVPAKHSGAVSANADPELTSKIRALDAKLFDAYNRCDLALFQTLFAPNVEFYHDDAGASFDAKTVVDNTRKNICGKVQRQLLPDTLKIYPIKNFGAIEEGEHVFCHLATGRCEGAARFLMIWEGKGDAWRLTRIVSHGHRPLSESEKALYAPVARSR